MASPVGRCENPKCLNDLFEGDEACRTCGQPAGGLKKASKKTGKKTGKK